MSNKPPAIIPDSHLRYDLVARVADTMDPDEYQIVIDGDYIDGPEPNFQRMNKLIIEIGAIVVATNHLYVLRNALSDSGMAHTWRVNDWARLEYSVLASYGVEKTKNWDNNAETLREAMADDVGVIDAALPYFEDDQHVYLHGGPKPYVAWEKQKKVIAEQCLPENRLHEKPDQLFDPDYLLSTTEVVPPQLQTDKYVISGHAHSSEGIATRVTGRRVRLASYLNEVGMPLYVWDGARQAIREFEQT